MLYFYGLQIQNYESSDCLHPPTPRPLYRVQLCTTFILWYLDKNNYINQGDRPLRNADNFTLPNPHTELFKKLPLYSLPLEWNNLDDAKYIRNRMTFKTAIKFSLLNTNLLLLIP